MAELAEIVALNMSKYLTKEATLADVRKKINRSRALVQHCRVKPDKGGYYGSSRIFGGSR